VILTIGKFLDIFNSKKPQTYASTAVDFSQSLEHLLVNVRVEYVNDFHVIDIHIADSAWLKLPLLEQLIKVAAILFESVHDIVFAQFLQESGIFKRSEVEGNFVSTLFTSS